MNVNKLALALLTAPALKAAAKGGSPGSNGLVSHSSFDLNGTSYTLGTFQQYDAWGSCNGHDLGITNNAFKAIQANCGNGTFGALTSPATNETGQLIAESNPNCGRDFIHAYRREDTAAQACVAAAVNGRFVVPPPKKNAASHSSVNAALALAGTLAVAVALL